WMLIAHPLAGSGPLTWSRVRLLTALDPLLVIASLGAVAGAFGGWTASMVAVVFGTYFPSRVLWTGGSFLRWDWLAALLAGIALCRSARPLAGGALLGYAALVRVFPGFALAGVALAAVATLIRERRIDRDVRRVLAGAAIVIALLAPLAGAVRRGDPWR